MSGQIEVRDDGATRWIRFDNPGRRNALDGGMLQAAARAIRDARSDGVRVIVLIGQGADFSAGADLNQFRHYSPLEVRDVNLETWIDLFEAIEDCPLPVVAAVRGWCIAGGTELILACDLVVASRTARFGLTEARVGVIPGAGACVRLPRWIGRAAAKEILMLGDPIEADEAWRLGLVNRLVDEDQLESAARELADRLTSRSPLAIAAAKRAVNVGAEMEQRIGIRYVLQEFALLFAGADQQEGMSAFLEKRQPRYQGQ
jgi:enoyl-CoA hydratase/carnithine racemase